MDNAFTALAFSIKSKINCPRNTLANIPGLAIPVTLQRRAIHSVSRVARHLYILNVVDTGTQGRDGPSNYRGTIYASTAFNPECDLLRAIEGEDTSNSRENNAMERGSNKENDNTMNGRGEKENSIMSNNNAREEASFETITFFKSYDSILFDFKLDS